MIHVEELLTRLGVQAEQKGRSWWACCPFHDERTPSWRMHDEPGSPKHGKHHCFACGEGGSAVYLAMRILGFEKPGDAWRWITSGQGKPEDVKLTISVDVAVPGVPREFRLPYGVEQVEHLRDWPAKPREYAELRGIEDWQVSRWRLGFARDGRLRGRIVIPIYGPSDPALEEQPNGKLLSYTARAWRANADRKYLEPKESEGADMSAIFGEEHWIHGDSGRGRNTTGGTIYVFEGALNALAAERAMRDARPALLEDRNVGAIHGSEFTPGHASKLMRFSRIVICSDPDRAGQKMRDAIHSLRRWCKIVDVNFPDGFDACDIEREHGRVALRELLAV